VLPNQTLRLSYLFPIVLQWRGLARKGFLVPAALTVLVAASLAGPRNFDYVAWAFASYCAITFLYLVYRLCGKSKSWLVLLASRGLGILSISFQSYNLFYPIHVVFGSVAGILFPGGEPSTLSSQFLYNLISIGLVEEATKFAPVLLFFVIAYGLSSPWREAIGVFEPIDGLLLGAASGAGFALFETVHQYIPDRVVESIPLKVLAHFINSTVLPQNPQLVNHPVAEIVALVQEWIVRNYSMQEILDIFNVNGASAMQVLIMRSLNDLAGHMAWAALFGYAFGLMILQPKKGWIALPVGYCLAAALHAFWDTDIQLIAGSGSGLIACLTQNAVISGLFSYSLLAAAILQARQLSPNRRLNFATERLEANHATRVGPEASRRNHPPYSLVVGAHSTALVSGTRIGLELIPGLRASSDNVVAEVRNSPRDFSVLGIKNMSTNNWKAYTPDGQVRQLEPGRLLRLARGVVIDFGSVRGQIQ
jgi:RsiW-degrading membrane proteinase PrsW (M82 family)